MMFLSEIYQSNKRKEACKIVSLKSLVSDAKKHQADSEDSLDGFELRFSQNGAVLVKKWDIYSKRKDK